MDEGINSTQEVARRLAEWSEWRGQINVSLEAQNDRFADLSNGLYSRLSDLDRNFNRRMDKQEAIIASILEQAKLTNGRVTQTEIELAKDRAVDEKLSSQASGSMARYLILATILAGFMSCLVAVIIKFL